MELIEQTVPALDGSTFAEKVILLAIVVVVAMVVQRMVIRVARRVLEAAEVPSASIFLNILRGIIWSFALLAVLQPVFGIEPTGFVAALGVSSVALSFGLQDTVSNLVGGLSLMITRVIVPGDVITVGGFTGKVTDINWRSTTVEARGGNTEVIPNSALLKSSFTKLTDGAAAASSFTVVVRHDADLQEVERDAIAAAKDALGELADQTREPMVQFGSMDVYGITMTVITFIVADVMQAAANDRVARALAGKPWLSRIA